MPGDANDSPPRRPPKRTLAVLAGAALAAIAILYVVVPRMAGLDATWGPFGTSTRSGSRSPRHSS